MGVDHKKKEDDWGLKERKSIKKREMFKKRKDIKFFFSPIKALGTESSKHSVLLVNEAKDLVGKDVSNFVLTKDLVRISLGDGGKGVSFKFGINSPGIEVFFLLKKKLKNIFFKNFKIF